MLPNVQSNRYGDLLKEFYDGIKNDNLSENRLGHIRDQFNILSEREEKYRSWLRQQDNKIGMNSLELPIFQIYSEVLAVDKASVDFPIPPECNHVILIMSGRSDAADFKDVIKVQFNGDSGNTYQWGAVQSVNTTASGVQDLSDPGMAISNLSGASANANAQGNSFVVIPHIQGAAWKAAIGFGGSQNYDGTNQVQGAGSGFWKSTEKIVKMTLSPYTGTVIKSGSIITVLGVR